MVGLCDGECGSLVGERRSAASPHFSLFGHRVSTPTAILSYRDPGVFRFVCNVCFTVTDSRETRGNMKHDTGMKHETDTEATKPLSTYLSYTVFVAGAAAATAAAVCADACTVCGPVEETEAEQQ